MRSINTSLISVLPILALIVIAVWLLGVGTLQDLALVQLVGVIVGTYSSIFFATPLLVAMRERTELVRVHTRRVNNRRKGVSARAENSVSGSDAEPEKVSVAAAPAPEKPVPGAKPVRPSGRPSGKRNTRR
jgi:preprotein translocase subunit SecF